MNVNIDNKEMAMAVPKGLPSRFQSLIVVFNALGNEDISFGLDYVKSLLLQEEQRAKKSNCSQNSAWLNQAHNFREVIHMKCTN